ncbi:MAG TPA: AMP-binding protein [Thermoanaerobaculia bacterium]|nr:AMP-binding protein [Thermoanaerobaculia bacterium]
MTAPAAPDSAAGANVVAILAEVARRVPARLALATEDHRGGGRQRASFAELWQRVDRASAGLRRLGLEPGERAIVMIPMSIDLYVVLLALLKLGAAAVFVDPWIGWRQIAAFAAFAAPRFYAGTPRSHLLRLLSGRLRAIPLTATASRRLGRLPAAHTLADLERDEGDGRIAPAAADDPALITFTSGSSGEPKGANRTHGFLLAQHRALAAEFPPCEDDVDMPMFPVFALHNLASGISSVVPAMDLRRVDQVDAGRILTQMAAHGVTTCTASPPFFDRIAAALADKPRRRPALRRLLSGGAPVSDAQLAAWQRALPATEVRLVYGSTEAEPVAQITAAERGSLQAAAKAAAFQSTAAKAAAAFQPTARLGFCVGRPGDQVKARVIRIHRGPVALGADGWAEWELPRGEIGELVVTGDHVGKDYYRNPRAMAENKIVDRDGTVWHRMGDTGWLDDAGRFWLAGRVHSTIFRAGQAVHPQLVEQAAQEASASIRRVAAVGLPDAVLGERVVLVIESPPADLPGAMAQTSRTSRSSPTSPASPAEALRRELADRLASRGQPVDDVILTRQPLPLDPRHRSKIDYPRLRERLLRANGARR